MTIRRRYQRFGSDDMPQEGSQPQDALVDVIDRLGRRLPSARWRAGRVYVVGGAVRDALLGRTPHELDSRRGRRRGLARRAASAWAGV